MKKRPAFRRTPVPECFVRLLADGVPASHDPVQSFAFPFWEDCNEDHPPSWYLCFELAPSWGAPSGGGPSGCAPSGGAPSGGPPYGGDSRVSDRARETTLRRCKGATTTHCDCGLHSDGSGPASPACFLRFERSSAGRHDAAHSEQLVALKAVCCIRGNKVKKHVYLGSNR